MEHNFSFSIAKPSSPLHPPPTPHALAPRFVVRGGQTSTQRLRLVVKQANALALILALLILLHFLAGGEAHLIGAFLIFSLLHPRFLGAIELEDHGPFHCLTSGLCLLAIGGRRCVRAQNPSGGDALLDTEDSFLQKLHVVHLRWNLLKPTTAARPAEGARVWAPLWLHRARAVLLSRGKLHDANPKQDVGLLVAEGLAHIARGRPAPLFLLTNMASAASECQSMSAEGRQLCVKRILCAGWVEVGSRLQETHTPHTSRMRDGERGDADRCE